MTDYIRFEGRVTPLEWGRATYTVLRLPHDVMSGLGKTRRVEGEINDHPFNLALTRAPVCPDVFLWAGQTLLQRVGIAPGEIVEVRLRPAPDNQVDLADDVLAALRAHDSTQIWANLTPGKQRGLLYHIETAKTPATRAKRIAALLGSLSDLV
jgi:hypothetical protein